MATYTNAYANKQFLNQQMTTILGYTPAAPTAPTGTFSANTTNKYVVNVASAANFYIGAFFSNSGQDFTIVGSITSAPSLNTYTLDTTFNPSSAFFAVDVPVTTISSPTYKVIGDGLHPPGSIVSLQDCINAFLNDTTQKNYSSIMALVVQYHNASSTVNGGFSGTSTSAKGRILLTIDDGSVFVDSSKCSINSEVITSLGTNTFQNYSKKINISFTNTTDLSSSNVLTVVSSNTNGSTISLTGGTAGGNYINENHNTRPEMLIALLSNSGIGYAKRFSSTLGYNNLYLAQRIGNFAEENVGSIRLSVPVASLT